MDLRITVLGSCGGYPRAGKACSGYLLRYEDSSLVLDLGSGALSNLLKYVPPDELGALAISHLHYDHYIDIYGLCTARRFWERPLSPLPVLAPKDAGRIISSPLAESSRGEFLKCIELIDAEGALTLDIAGFQVTARPVEHFMDSYGFRVTVGGHTVCYSGDTDRSDNLARLARGSELFICESTFTSEIPQKIPGHLLASEAGVIAAEAGVGKLLLTHLWPTLDEDRALEDARAAFDGPVELAVEGLTLDI